MSSVVENSDPFETMPLLSVRRDDEPSSFSSGNLNGRTFKEVKCDIERHGATVRDVKKFDDNIFIAAFISGFIFFAILVWPCYRYSTTFTVPYYVAFFIGGDAAVSALIGIVANKILRCMYGYRSSQYERDEIIRLFREAVMNNVLELSEKKELIQIARDNLDPVV